MRRSTPKDPEFLDAVSQAFKDLLDRRPDLDESKMADALKIDQTTLSKYIHKHNSVRGDVLARACVDLGLTLKYRGLEISAASFPQVLRPSVVAPPRQLEFLFDAKGQSESARWVASHNQKVEPMELVLTIKIAS